MTMPRFNSPKLFTVLLVFSILLLAIHIDLVVGGGGSSRQPPSAGLMQLQCLTVPAPEFLTSIESTINVVRKVMGAVSHLGRVFMDLRLSVAISDCLDLLDFSTDELSWAASATQNPNSKHNGTGDLGSDLQTWLSAALVNQDTCIEGFDGTSNILKGLVSSSISEITSLVRDLLSKVYPSSKPKSYAAGGGGGGGGVHGHGGRKSTAGDAQQFPSWVRPNDRKLLRVSRVAADVVVAQDGTGNFTSVRDAVMAAPDYSSRRFLIYVKKGVYKENVEIKKKKWNVMMVGDGMDVTVISGNRSFIGGWTTFRSATFAVSGRGFIARNMTFEKTVGPEKYQAVAVRSDSDLSVFYRCSIKGYRDTLYTHALRQFFRECRISGTVDFIFGDASALFQNCLIQPKKGLQSQKNTITAQAQKESNQPTGFSFQFCNITADLDLQPFINTTMTYLGRPWKLYSRAVFMQSYLSEVPQPEGWLEWNDNFALNTLFYGEYMNNGPGAGLGRRIKWPGFHVLNSSSQAVNYTVAQFIEGNSWLPSTGVTYVAGFGL